MHVIYHGRVILFLLKLTHCSPRSAVCSVASEACELMKRVIISRVVFLLILEQMFVSLLLLEAAPQQQHQPSANTRVANPCDSSHQEILLT